MKTTFNALSLFALVVVGCNSGTEQTSVAEADSGAPVVMDEMPPMIDDTNGHPEHGPHGGDLVELGNEAFHVELVHGDGSIAMYVLDGSASKPVAIAADKLVVSLKHDGQVATFDLVAKPDNSEPAGQASRFFSSEPKLDQWLDAGAEGVVVLEVEGKSYTGKVAHAHAGHDH